MRNKITTTGYPSSNDIKLCMNVLQDEILSLNPNDFDRTCTYTFQYATYAPNDNKFCTRHMHCFKETDLYQGNRLVEIIDGHRLERFPETFHQTDESIRYAIYEILKSFVMHESILMLGGECYLFPFFFPDAQSITVYTDMSSIALDVAHNHPFVNVECIAYSQLVLTRSFDLTIINVGHDLPDSVWDSLDCNHVLIIRCRPRKDRRLYPVHHVWNFGYVTIEWCQYSGEKAVKCIK